MIDKGRALTHYRDRLERVNRVRAAQGHPPLSRRTVEHDRSIATYDREGRR